MDSMVAIDLDSIPIAIPIPIPRIAPVGPAVRGKPKPRLEGVVDYPFHRTRSIFFRLSAPGFWLLAPGFSFVFHDPGHYSSGLA